MMKRFIIFDFKKASNCDIANWAWCCEFLTNQMPKLLKYPKFGDDSLFVWSNYLDGSFTWYICMKRTSVHFYNILMRKSAYKGGIMGDLVRTYNVNGPKWLPRYHVKKILTKKRGKIETRNCQTKISAIMAKVNLM